MLVKWKPVIYIGIYTNQMGEDAQIGGKEKMASPNKFLINVKYNHRKRPWSIKAEIYTTYVVIDVSDYRNNLT